MWNFVLENKPKTVISKKLRQEESDNEQQIFLRKKTSDA